MDEKRKVTAMPKYGSNTPPQQLISAADLQRIASYLDRGRHYRNLSMGDLDAQLVTAYRRWRNAAFNFEGPEHVDTDDTVAEYALREAPPPVSILNAEIDGLTSKVAQRVVGVSDTQRQEITDQLIAELAKLIRLPN